MLETLGKDLCRTLLIYCSIYVPPELKDIFKIKTSPSGQIKHFSEDDDDIAVQMNKLILEELTENKELLKLGEGGSTSGSDSAPSDDNLPQSFLNKNLPPIEK